jgi:hypothetical protein
MTLEIQLVGGKIQIEMCIAKVCFKCFKSILKVLIWKKNFLVKTTSPICSLLLEIEFKHFESFKKVHERFLQEVYSGLLTVKIP